MLDSEWQSIFQSQMKRLIEAAPSYASVESPDQAAKSIVELLLYYGSAAVEETRTRLTHKSDNYPRADDVEPMLGLIQLFSGAVYAVAEADLFREECGIRSIFRFAPLSSRYALVEIAKAARAVLVLSSRSLDVQAVAVLRQTWEFVARSVLLASDPELAARFETLTVTNISRLAERYAPDPELDQYEKFTVQVSSEFVEAAVDLSDPAFATHSIWTTRQVDPEERKALEFEVRDRLKAPGIFRHLATIERDVSQGTSRQTGLNKAHRRFEDLYRELSDFTHGGPDSAFVSDSSWTYWYREETLPDGVSGPVYGEEPWHFVHLTRQLFLLLDYFVWLYPAVEFSSGEPSVMWRFFEDWLASPMAYGNFENEYRLYLGLEVLSLLGNEYHAVVLGKRG